MKLRYLPEFSFFSNANSKLALVVLGAVVSATAGCKNERNNLGSESEVNAAAGGSLNGGFRILPQLAARDPLRSKVIYRCNDVACGEAFQPSNEERDLFLPCGVEANLYPGGRLPPFLRLVGTSGKQRFLVRTEHKQACERAVAFEKVVNEAPPRELAQNGSVGSTCRSFRNSREVCLANEAQGCRWVTHPSGRATLPGAGDCVGLFRAPGQPTGTENVQSLQIGSQPVSWAPVESYRPAGTGRNSDLK
ncbi:MAG: hypothetical protein RI932_2580 [Pseudomonadota bacterium]|jgi:hypothetical protein